MVSTTQTALTANEAAIVTHIPVRQVHRIIDAGVLPLAKGSRIIERSALVGLRVASLTANTLTLDTRRQVVAKVIMNAKSELIVEKVVVIRPQPIAAEIEDGLALLEKAKASVRVDKAIMGGTPCISGTRIPVHMIAQMRMNGDSEEAILAAYPNLSADQIRLASIYAQAYPLRGRSPIRKPAWLRKSHKTTEILNLVDLPTP